MGSFAFSLHVKSDDCDAVTRAVSGYLAESGYQATEQEPGREAVWGGGSGLRAVRVSRPHGGWVSLLDSDMLDSASLAAAVSRSLETHVLQVMVNDSDSWHYQLFYAGGSVDEFDSGGEELWGEFDAELDAMTERELESLPPEIKEQLGSLAEQLEAMMPPEVREIQDRMNRGEASQQDMQRFAAWMSGEFSPLIGGLSDALADYLEKGDLDEDASGNGEPFGDFDDELDDDLDEWEEEEEAGGSASIPFNKLFDQAGEPGSPEEAAQHLERLRPLLAGAADEQVTAVLGGEAVFAEHLLAQFLPLLGISPFYAHLSYGYFPECSSADLEGASIAMADHLKFAAK